MTSDADPIEEAITAELRPHLDLWSTPDQSTNPPTA
jgi:hypothetical protein